MDELVESDKIKALLEINNRINSNYGDPDALLVSILESVMAMVRCESASLILHHKEDNTLRFAITLGPKSSEVKKIPVKINSIAGWVYTNRKAQIINQVPQDTRFNDEVQLKTQYYTRNMIAFPMQYSGTCYGVIECINKADDQDFTQSDLEILELLGGQASIAYHNSKDFLNIKYQVSSLQETMNNGREYHPFIAKSPVINDLMDVINQVAQTNSSVLIIGESGVGKELFAEQIHLKSQRSNKPFVRVSCAALSPSLLESELFGHVKGAFTDAVKDQKGRFELANGGTLFLDEIGELPLNLQSKLLRAIQEKKFERVGSSETISVDVRIVAATNRDLEEMVNQGTFRSDLYYRLNVMLLKIPPLRQRKDDIEPLADFFLEHFSNETKKNIFGFTTAAMNMLYEYYWPGNVRELENTIERACILCKGDKIEVNELCLPSGMGSGEVSAERLSSKVTDSLMTGNSRDKSLKAALNAFKKEYITRVLKDSNWNQTEAAKVLDIQRTYVSKLMNELGITPLK